MGRRIIRQPDAAVPAALNFDASGSGRRVDHGSAASLDDLHQGANGFTAWAWLVRTSNGSNQTFISKRSSSTVGWSLLVDGAPGEGSLRSVFLRTTTHSDCTSVAGVVPINKPTFVAITFNDADATEAAMYAGTLSDAATEVTYSSNINGSGSFYSDATANLYAGNLQQGLIYPFRGLIGRYGIVNRKLTQNELRRIQFGTMRQARVQGTVLLCEPWRGHAKVIDQSGNGNDGTITSATYAPRLWTGVSFDEPDGWVSKAAGTGATTQTATASLSAAVRIARTASASLAAAVRAEISSTASLSSAVRVERTASVSLAAALQTARTATAALTAAVQAARTGSASADVAVQTARTATTSLGAAVQQARTAATSVTAAVQAPQAATASLSAAVRAVQATTASLSAAVRAARSATASLSAYVQAGTTASASLDLAVQLARSASASVDVAVALSRSATVALSAAVAEQRSASVLADAVIQAARTGSVGLSAYIVDESDTGVSDEQLADLQAQIDQLREQIKRGGGRPEWAGDPRLAKRRSIEEQNAKIMAFVGGLLAGSTTRKH